MGDHAIHPRGQQAEPAPDTTDKERVEAVKAGKDFAGEILGVIGLFAEKHGVDIGAIKQDHPVTGQQGMENGNKINGGGAAERFSFGPDADRIDLVGDFEITFLLGSEVFHSLEGGDEFAAPGVPGNILDGVTGGQHGLVVEEVGHIGNREHGDLRTSAGAGFAGSRKNAGVFGFEIRAKTGAKKLFRSLFFRSPTNHMGKPEIAMQGGACKRRREGIRKT